mmetsp:Transcript_20500/g.25207  ORF Transcript_20500/g.25207 Transcript_20500/m.25207 type:complete len:166 (-) Transcript_20500:484-981(-)|eukprot:CAMPEP_0170454532 /NCGR_PEP_ID=MMETSP0123-20130129/2755_1 /TAXON_ID=182087 /ORGANISM="Favella ehrenbergii, Strain Fehren 1" /LENGTH=165 /DNA_ID=CAMNT_0010717281 /DNA_START=943 /DNA_END=1440 /DNA_ORIENTATION=+
MIEDSVLQKALQSDLFEKYEKFKAAKLLEQDPLIRFCPKPECGTHIRAENNKVDKVECPECNAEICVKCRDVWHGNEVTCEQALDRQLEGWVEENSGNVSFCPMCRTRIEKNKACNHMTCYFCKYEFCWACGASAKKAECHFDFGKGCGVDVVNEKVKPGDHLFI